MKLLFSYLLIVSMFIQSSAMAAMTQRLTLIQTKLLEIKCDYLTADHQGKVVGKVAYNSVYVKNNPASDYFPELKPLNYDSEKNITYIRQTVEHQYFNTMQMCLDYKEDMQQISTVHGTPNL